MTRMRTTVASALAGALAWAGPALAQGQSGSVYGQPDRERQQQTQRQGKQGQGQGQRQGQLSQELRSSLQKLHAANQAEIQLGQSAQDQAQSQQVKQFAQRMTEDHRKADGQLEQVAQRMGVNLKGEEYQSAMKESREKRQELSQKRGAEFDRAYMEYMVSDHQEDLQQVHDAAKKAGEEAHPQLAQALGQTEARLHQHHAMAQRIQQRLERQGGQAQAGGSQEQGQVAAAPGSAGSAAQGGEPEQQAQQPGQQQSQEQTAQSQQGQAGGSQQASKSVVGTVESVGSDKLSLKNQLGETHEFSIGENTRFTRGGQEISREQIGEGDQVRAAFTGEGQDLEATEISVMSSRGSGGQGSTGASEPQEQREEQREEQKEQQKEQKQQ